jgi:translocation and assembly module TamB
MTFGGTIRRAALVTLGAIFVLLAAAFVIIHTSVFTGYVRGKIVQVAREKLGSRVEIRSVSIPWDQLAIEIRGLTLRGREAKTQPPLLQIRRLKVGVNVGAILGGHLKLSRVIVDQPVVHINVNSQGQNNFSSNPGKKPTTNSPSTLNSLFDLAIRHMEIHQGTIDYNDAKIPLSADLTDFDANVSFNGRLGEYQGSVGYRNGWIKAKSFERFDSSASLQFAASRSGIRCDPLSVTLPDSRISLYAKVENYSDPHISGRYTAEISTTELAQVLREPALPAGSVSTSGTIDYQSAAGRSFLGSVRLEGTLISRELDVQLRQFTAPVKALRAHYSISDGVLKIANFQGETLGGKLSVRSGQIALTGKTPSRLDAALTAVSLADVSRALPSGSYDRVSLVGRADVSARLSWSGQFRNLIADADAKLYTRAGQRLSPGASPLNGRIQIAYNKALDQASLGNSEVRIGETTVSATGVLSKHSNVALVFSAGDLHQLSEVAVEIATAVRSKGSAPFRLPNISGSARFAGRAYGSLENPQLAGRLIARNVEFDSTHWRTIETNLTLSRSRAAFSNGELDLQPRGRVRVGGTIGLRDWSLAPSSALSLHATAEDLQIAQMQALAHKNYPVSGNVSAELSVSGTKQDPIGKGWIHVTNASAWNQRLRLVAVSFHGDITALHADLSVAAAAGALNGTVTYDSQTQQYQARVNAPGIKLADLEMVRTKRLPIRGTLIVTGSGSGSIANPQFSADVEIPQLDYRGEAISGFRSQMNLADQQLRYTANGSLYGGDVTSQGEVTLAGGYETKATLDAHSISVGMLAAHFLHNSKSAPQGQVDLNAELQGPLKHPAELDVRAEVPPTAVTYQTVRISLVRPLVLNYRNGIATVYPSELKGPGIDLSFQGAIPIKRTNPFRLEANGTVNLAVFQSVFQPATSGFQSAGTMKIDLAAQGTFAQPNMQGNLDFQNVSFSSGSFPVNVSRINGDVRVSGRRMEIVNLTGSVNGGAMKAQGSVDLGRNPAFDLAVAAQSVNINYPSGVRARLDGNLRLNGTAATSALTGRVVIDYLGFTQQMDVATLASKFSSSGGVSTPSAFERHTKLNIAIQSSSTLSLASTQLSIQGAANLTVVGTLADPVIVGRATLTGGELFFLGKRYDIKSGTIEFANPTETRPSVDLYATTTVNQYKISLHFLGPVDEMKTNFTSTPALPQADIINLLAFGQTTEQAATSPTPGSLGAESVLAQGVASQLTGKIQKLAGLSQLSITPIIAANGVQQPGPGAQVAIQQRVSGRLLVTFTTDTAETQATAVQVQYDLGGGLSISALRDENGGYGIDVHLHKSF